MFSIKYEEFRRQRILRGWSQERVAKIAGVSASTVSKIERGDRAGAAVKKVADALGVAMEDIVIKEESVA